MLHANTSEEEGNGRSGPGSTAVYEVARGSSPASMGDVGDVVTVHQTGNAACHEPPRHPFWHVHKWERSSLIKVAILLGAVAGIITVFTVLPTNEYLKAYAEWSKGRQVEGAFILAAIYIVLTVLLFPCSILTVLAGLLFGLPIAVPTVVLSATAGSTLSFILGRYLLHDWVKKFVERYQTMTAIYKVIGRAGFKVCILLRLSPIIPFNALNYALALTPVTLRSYILSTFLGIIPGTTLFCYIGSTAKSVAEATSGTLSGGAAQQALFWVGLAMTIIVTLGITWFARKELVKELAEDPEGQGEGDDDPSSQRPLRGEEDATGDGVAEPSEVDARCVTAVAAPEGTSVVKSL